MDRKFYDIHYHLFDLSHPNLLAFILRDDLISGKALQKIFKRIPFLFKILPLWVASLFTDKISTRIKDYLKHDAGRFLNLLSVIEGAIEYHFLFTEHFLLKEIRSSENSEWADFRKVVICPLIIDFGYKNFGNLNFHYNFPPAKPIANQVLDLFNSIYFYFNYDLELDPIKPGKFILVPTSSGKEKKLFEIYPFLGINTQNYDLQGIKELFEKYFMGYEDDKNPADRQSKLFSKMGTVKLDLEEMIFRKREAGEPGCFSYLFAGIKLYPPLGFDPWPSENPVELEKVRFLYSECVRLNLPVTVHCSSGGYKASPFAEKFTDPSRKWRQVLSQPEYKNLRINFSHMGSQTGNNTDWQNTIFEFMSHNRNVYTDCSSVTPLAKDYEIVRGVMDEKTESGILFGTDFIINLLWSDSYNDYLNNFLRTPYLDDSQKKKICEINPERFLFG